MSEKKIIYCKDFGEQKEKYENYIAKHQMNVIISYYLANNAFKELFPEVYNNTDVVEILENNIKYHDTSKFNIEEFIPYANRFFPLEGTDPESEQVKSAFNLAWFNHLRNNPHHPAYWTCVDDGEAKIYDMPYIYIIEMLCDWMAMSMYYNSTTYEYWNSESAQKLSMTDNTRAKVNEFMEWMLKNNVHTLW